MARSTLTCLAIALLCTGCGRGLVTSFDDLPESPGIADAEFPRLADIPDSPPPVERNLRDSRIADLRSANAGATALRLDSGVDEPTSRRLAEIQRTAQSRAQAAQPAPVIPVAVPQGGTLVPPQIDRTTLLAKAQSARTRMPAGALRLAAQRAAAAPGVVSAKPAPRPDAPAVLSNGFRDAARKALSRRPDDV